MCSASGCVTSAQACHGATGDGYVVVGSEDGKVRLYSTTTLTMAKTAIPGLGAPITNVDVTYDGKWVLATTDKYVMVVKTTFRDKSGRYAFRQYASLQSFKWGCLQQLSCMLCLCCAGRRVASWVAWDRHRRHPGCCG